MWSARLAGGRALPGMRHIHPSHNVCGSVSTPLLGVHRGITSVQSVWPPSCMGVGVPQQRGLVKSHQPAVPAHWLRVASVSAPTTMTHTPCMSWHAKGLARHMPAHALSSAAFGSLLEQRRELLRLRREQRQQQREQQEAAAKKRAEVEPGADTNNTQGDIAAGPPTAAQQAKTRAMSLFAAVAPPAGESTGAWYAKLLFVEQSVFCAGVASALLASGMVQGITSALDLTAYDHQFFGAFAIASCFHSIYHMALHHLNRWNNVPALRALALPLNPFLATRPEEKVATPLFGGVIGRFPLNPTPNWLAMLVLGLLTGGMLLVNSLSFEMSLSSDPDEADAADMQLASLAAGTWASMLGACFAVPAAYEWVFRGILFSRWVQLSPLGAYLGVNALYAWLTADEQTSFRSRFSLGMTMTFAYHVSGRLWLPLVISMLDSLGRYRSVAGFAVNSPPYSSATSEERLTKAASRWWYSTLMMAQYASKVADNKILTESAQLVPAAREQADALYDSLLRMDNRGKDVTPSTSSITTTSAEVAVSDERLPATAVFVPAVVRRLRSILPFRVFDHQLSRMSNEEDVERYRREFSEAVCRAVSVENSSDLSRDDFHFLVAVLAAAHELEASALLSWAGVRSQHTQ